MTTIKKKKYPLPPYVYIERELLSSEAFQKLSKSAIKVLLRFLQKRAWQRFGRGKKSKIVYTNSGLVLTYNEADDMGIKTNAFYEAVKRLVAVGFLEVDHQGGAYGQDYSRYSLSDRWRAYGTPDFKEVLKKRSLQKGCDIQSNIRRKNPSEGVRIYRGPVEIRSNSSFENPKVALFGFPKSATSISIGRGVVFPKRRK